MSDDARVGVAMDVGLPLPARGIGMSCADVLGLQALELLLVAQFVRLVASLMVSVFTLTASYLIQHTIVALSGKTSTLSAGKLSRPVDRARASAAAMTTGRSPVPPVGLQRQAERNGDPQGWSWPAVGKSKVWGGCSSRVADMRCDSSSQSQFISFCFFLTS